MIYKMLVTLIVFSSSVQSVEIIQFTTSSEHSELSVKQKKNKLILSCKPSHNTNIYSSIWVTECNNMAYNLLTMDFYQNILADKDIRELPFGGISYEKTKESGSFMHRKSLRKSFKIHTD